MRLGQDRKMPPSLCLHCGKLMDGATGLVIEEDTAPDPGDITVCIYCGHVMAYDEDIHLRELTPEEQIEIAGDERILAIQRARAVAFDRTKKEKK